MKCYSFFPRSDSRIVFILASVCLIWTVTSFLRTLVEALQYVPPPGFFLGRPGERALRIGDLLLFSPIVESAVLVAVIELLRWFRSPSWLQVFGSALVLAFLHSVGWTPWGFIVAPSFAIMACAYLFWRPSSRRAAFVIVVCTHALHNLMPAISNMAYAIRHV